MSLPQLNNDFRYNVTLPLSGETLEIRPYLVKEEKILLTAMESENKEEIGVAVEKILTNCTFGHDVKSLPLLDIEYLMLKIKAYSAGEVVTVHVRCNNEVTRPTLNPETGEATGEETTIKCGHITDIDIDLDKELEVDTDSIHDNKIQLTDDVGIALRPPTFDLFEDMLNSDSSTEISFDILTSCVDYIWDQEEVFRDFTSEEIEEFIGNLNKKQLKAIKDYLESIPELEVQRDFKCAQCGYEQKLVLRNFFDFFTD